MRIKRNIGNLEPKLTGRLNQRMQRKDEKKKQTKTTGRRDEISRRTKRREKRSSSHKQKKAIRMRVQPKFWKLST